jgi:hypothetical protein
MKSKITMPENTDATPLFPGLFEYRNPKFPHENCIVYIARDAAQGGLVMAVGPENTDNCVGDKIENIALDSSSNWYKLPPGTKIEIEV